MYSEVRGSVAGPLSKKPERSFFFLPSSYGLRRALEWKAEARVGREADVVARAVPAHLLVRAVGVFFGSPVSRVLSPVHVEACADKPHGAEILRLAVFLDEVGEVEQEVYGSFFLRINSGI